MIKNTPLAAAIISCVCGVIVAGCSGKESAIFTGLTNDSVQQASSLNLENKSNFDLLSKQKKLTSAEVDLSQAKAVLLAAESRKYLHSFDALNQKSGRPYTAGDCADALDNVNRAEQKVMSAELDVTYAVTMTKFYGMQAAFVSDNGPVSASSSTNALTHLIEQY